MYQLFTILLTNWIMPNRETDTPMHHTVRVVLLVVIAGALAKFI